MLIAKEEKKESPARDEFDFLAPDSPSRDEDDDEGRRVASESLREQDEEAKAAMEVSAPEASREDPPAGGDSAAQAWLGGADPAMVPDEEFQRLPTSVGSTTPPEEYMRVGAEPEGGA